MPELEVTDQPGVMSSNHPAVEALGQEGISKGIDEMTSGKAGGSTQPGASDTKPPVDPLAAMEKRFNELQRKYDTEIGRRFNGVDSYKHKVATLENELKMLQSKSNQTVTDPEQAAILEQQKKYVLDLLKQELGLDKDAVENFRAANEREAVRLKMENIQASVSDFSETAKTLAGSDYEKLEPFCVQLVEEWGVKAKAQDPEALRMVGTPGNLLWNAQRMFAENTEAQGHAVNAQRTRAVEKNVTLKGGSAPRAANGRFSEKDLDSLSIKDLPALSQQIDEMERSRR